MRLYLHLGFFAGIIFLLAPAILSGQNYHPLPDEDIRIYWGNQGWFMVPPSIQLRGVETVADGKRLLTNGNYLEKNPTGEWESCFHNTGNWWAEEIIWNEGLLTLIMEDGSKLSLDTRLEEGQSSDLTGVNDDLEMTMAVVSKEEQQTLAGLDSVKTFKVSIFDKNSGEPVEDHFYHGKEVVIGKNTGLISTFPFNAAILSPYLNGDYILPVDLDIKVRTVDEIIPDYLDFFPFEVGDQLHILTTATTGPPDNSEEKEKLTFIKREYDPQTGQLILTYEREMQSYSNYFGDVTFYEKMDTGVWTVKPDQWLSWEMVPGFFDHIPGEPVLTEVGDDWAELELYIFVPQERSTFNQRKLAIHRENLTESFEDDCEYTFLTPYDRLVYSHFYVESMGGGYYYFGDHHGTSSRKPVYVSTADFEWGEPFDFTVHTLELEEQQNFLLYPNPVKSGENLRLEVGDIKAESYQIYQLDRKVQSGLLDPFSEQHEIETGSLNPGFHHIELKMENGRVVIKRIVVME